MKIWTVDAFTNKPFAGNPAAVVIVDEFPSDQFCKLIAAEMNLSETAFVKPIGTHHFHIRWFTPKVEVKLCGHATLAASHILHQEKFISGSNIVFDSLSGQLRVTVSSLSYTLDFPLQKTGNIIHSAAIRNCFKECIQAVEAYDDIIIELKSEEALGNYVPQIDQLEKIDCRGIIVTARGKDYDFVSRFFAPKVGVYEDPVTGSSHCKLAYYWQQKLHKNEFIAYQASSRGGEIHVSVVGARNSIS